MNQSDSPDFEFDVSDLEVEGEDAPASEKGETTSVSKQPTAEDSRAAASNSDGIGQFEDDGDEELKGFAIDEMPDVSEATPQAATESPAPSLDSSESDPEAQAGPNPVTRIETEKKTKPSRTMGDDDLGADVFAEIESDPGAFSFEDVIDDLMEEVDEFEAGGFVELDGDSVKVEGGDEDGLFKLDDPDDSLVHSIDPNAVEESESPPPASPAFPAPPANFEIPADPEPDEEKAESTIDAAAEPAPQTKELSSENFPAAETPATPKSPVQQPAKATVPESPVFEIPADSEASEARSYEASVAVQSEIGATEAGDSNLSTDIPESDLAGPEPVTPEAEGEKEPGQGFERVLFDAAEEESKLENFDADTDVESQDNIEEPIEVGEIGNQKAVTSDNSEAEETGEPVVQDSEENVSEELEAISEVSESDTEAVTESEVPDTQDVEENVSEVEGLSVLEDDEDSEDDLSDLLAAVEEDGGLEEPEEIETSDVSQPENEPAQEIGEETLAGSEAIEESSESDFDSASEVEDESEERSEDSTDAEDEEDDLSDLISAASSGEEETEDLSEVDVEAGSTAEGEDSEDVDLGAIDAEELPEDLENAETSEESPDEAFAMGEDELASLIDANDSEAEEEMEIPGSSVEPSSELEVLDEEVVEGTEASDETAETTGSEVDEESVEVSDAGVDSVSENAETEEGESEDPEPEKKVAQSAEELLMQAGSLFSGGGNKPAEDASELLNNLVVEDDEEEIVAMPDPASMIAEAIGDEDEELVAMPDPAALIAEADETDEAETKSGNVVDRAGDLPPPPPAPIEIIDEEPPDEDFQADEDATDEEEFESIAGLVEVSDEASVEGEPEAESSLEDPFATEISLEDFEEDLEGLGGLEGEETELPGESDAVLSSVGNADTDNANKIVELPKPSLLWRLTHSLSIAAGVALIGLASVLAVWKQQIVEYIEGRDLDGSALVSEIKEIGTHALNDLDENGLYRMQWVDSEVRRVSDNEIRLYALVGAKLRENLYLPVLESELDEEFQMDEPALLESLALAHDQYPEEIGYYPDKPWKSLYRISASKDEIVPLKVTYGVTRESEAEEWQLSRVKVAGYREELKWPEGQPRYAFGEDAYDVDSVEFKEVFASYKQAATNFIAGVNQHKTAEAKAALALKRDNERQRERVKMALAEGTFFDGIAIIGEDGAESRDIQLVITEVRDEGAFVKGVVKMSSDDAAASKYFVGNLDFEKTLSGHEQGFLNLKTVSVDLPDSPDLDTVFFEPRSSSRMRLKADGFRLEGDSRDLSLRLTRSL